ncbi:hypothetical protein WMF20_05510 [Sorangium sp. So ce834]
MERSRAAEPLRFLPASLLHGVTLYEMLTGELPFPATDPLELVQSHVARQPTPPHERAPGVPEAVSNIVMKLLSKAAEDRY